jgi:hypothetical protein
MATDPLTRREFQPHRTNQKFESPENQIRYNNLKAQRRRKAMAEVNKSLNKNFGILNKLMPNTGTAIFHKQFLLGKEFRFDVFTHIETYENTQYYALYNFIIIPIDQDHIKIVKK